jgi:hypothetical protein
MSQNYWAGPRGKDGWGVKPEGSSHDIRKFRTQAEAWKIAQLLGKLSSSESFLQGRNGRIRERNTFGNDSYPPRG